MGVENNLNMNSLGIAKKYWAIESKEGEKLEFFPIFEANEETGLPEASKIQLRFHDKAKGELKTFTFNYLDVYMFMYFVANEELRQGLLAKSERKTNYIPYDVRIELSQQEKSQGFANRRIELPVDELTMSIARNEAWKMWIKSQSKTDPRAFNYKKRK